MGNDPGNDMNWLIITVVGFLFLSLQKYKNAALKILMLPSVKIGLGLLVLVILCGLGYVVRCNEHLSLCLA